MPLGYAEFATTFNERTIAADHRRISTVTYDENGVAQIQKSGNPVPITDFFITPEQTGIPNLANRRNEDQFSVIEEYAKTMARQSKKRDQAIQDRRDKQSSFFAGVSNPRALKRRRNNYRGNTFGRGPPDMETIYFGRDDPSDLFREGNSQGSDGTASGSQTKRDLTVPFFTEIPSQSIDLVEAFRDLPNLPEDVDLSDTVDKPDDHVPQTGDVTQPQQEEMQE
jgi:hypothetical protein